MDITTDEFNDCTCDLGALFVTGTTHRHLGALVEGDLETDAS